MIATQETSFEPKQVNTKTRRFRGLASTWDVDLGGDKVMPGAYARTLQKWRAGKRPLPLIDQHNYTSIRSVIGKLVDASETAQGLETEWEMLDTRDGDEALKRVQGGFIDSLSIGYNVVRSRPGDEVGRREGIKRYLDELVLHEVSLVVYPMNPAARIQKAVIDEEADRVRKIRDLEHYLRTSEDGMGVTDPRRLALEHRLRALQIRDINLRSRN